MDKRNKKTIEKSIKIDQTMEGFQRGLDFIVGLLKRRKIANAIIDETQLVYEALYHNIVEQTEDHDPGITISEMGRFGDVRIKIGFEGAMYIPPEDLDSEEEDAFAFENSILRNYGDRIDYTYSSGRNAIFIHVKRSYGKVFQTCIVAVGLAILVYVLLNGIGGPEAATRLLDFTIYPIECLFANAMLMLAAPVTFFSLLKNLTDTYILATNESGLRKIQMRTMHSSLVVIFVAIGIAFGIRGMWRSFNALDAWDPYFVHLTFSDLLESLVPSDMFEPFRTMSPFPLIFIAVLTVLAFCYSVKYFDIMKKANDVLCALFSSMLTIVMSTLPFFTFTAVLDILIRSEVTALNDICLLIAVQILSPAILWLFGAVRLKAAGVSVLEFQRKIKDLVMENIKINSSIDAVPFNIRYCTRVFGLNRKKIEGPMRVLAQINLDGNCFIITLASMLLLMLNQTSISFVNVVVIALLVFFLSLGAPNQPGSILIGLVIIFSYMSASELLPMAICCEVFLGGLQNLINVIGDIIIVRTIDKEKEET